MMRMDRFTTAAQQALADAQSDAVGRSNPEVGGLHILRALLKERGGAPASILTKAGIDAARVNQVVEAELGRLPKVSGSAGSTGRAAVELLTKADELARALSDSYVSSSSRQA